MTIDDVRGAVADLFRPASPGTGPEKIGLEVEVIPMRLATRTRVHPDEISPLLQSWVLSRQGTESISAVGVPSWFLPGGGAISWEPGGQLEYASPPTYDLGAVVREARDVLLGIAERLESEGIALFSAGMDPWTRVEDTSLVLSAPRYRAMTRHYGRRGPDGERMMRLTAGMHVNLDLGPRPLRRWRAANRIVPGLMAAFANSPARQDASEAHRSHRAEQWRRLDPTRTGGFPGDDPIEEYLAFALEAEAFALVGEDRSAPRLRDLLPEIDASGIRQHLSTLFPEVRPRGYLELRFFDALPAAEYGLPAAAASGLLLDEENEAWAASELPAPTRERLERAGRLGVRDPELHAEACDLLARASRGLARLDASFGAEALLPALDAFRSEVTCRALDPGDCVDHDLRSRITPAGCGLPPE